MKWYKIADYDPTRTRIDYDRKAHQAYIQPSDEGYSVFNTEDNSYLLSFKSPDQAQAFAKEYDAANMRRKGVGKVYEKYLPLSLDSTIAVPERSKIIRMDPNEKFDREQAERDLVLAPQTWHERRERYLKLRSQGLPHVPIMKDEVEQFRMKPARPHGIELPGRPEVKDVPSVEELKKEKYPALIAYIAKTMRFAQVAAPAVPGKAAPAMNDQATQQQPPMPQQPQPQQKAQPQQTQPQQPVPGQNSHNDDMQYLVSPEGVEHHVPGFSHSGEAQKIVMQTEGREMDPAEALDYLLKKKKWIRVSGDTFQMAKFKFRRPVIQQFISRHMDYFRDVRVLEIDDLATNDINQMPMSAFLQGVSPDSEALQRAQEMRRWRD
jgi:hypothetical protein